MHYIGSSILDGHHQTIHALHKQCGAHAQSSLIWLIQCNNILRTGALNRELTFSQASTHCLSPTTHLLPHPLSTFSLTHNLPSSSPTTHLLPHPLPTVSLTHYPLTHYPPSPSPTTHLLPHPLPTFFSTHYPPSPSPTTHLLPHSLPTSSLPTTHLFLTHYPPSPSSTQRRPYLAPIPHWHS